MDLCIVAVRQNLADLSDVCKAVSPESTLAGDFDVFSGVGAGQRRYMTLHLLQNDAHG